MYMKKLCLGLALLLLICAPITGCGQSGAPEATVAPEAAPTPGMTENGDIIICAVNGVNIMRSEFEPIFNMYYQYYTINGFDLSSEESLKLVQDTVFDGLVRAEVVRQQAEKEGLALTAQEEQSIKAAVEEELAQFLAEFETYAASEGAEDVKARAEEMLIEALALDNMTVEIYKERSAREMRKAKLAEKLRDKVVADITLSAQEAQASFAADVEQARATYTENPALYESAVTAYNTSGGIPPLFIPEGFVRVRHILVADETTAKELINELDAGADFGALMAEHGTDPGMKREPEMTQGYLMGATTNFVPEFKDAGLALENIGDYTEPVKSSHGYHIIRLEDKLTSRALTYEEIGEAYLAGKRKTLQDDHYTQLLQTWIDEGEIVSYIGRIRDMGEVG